jgi:protein-S-isoprenylcysteine O-methyltransferase Ste14
LTVLQEWKCEAEMSRALKFFLVVIVPTLAILLGLLGVVTLCYNPLGWFLTLVGGAFTVGIFVDFAIRKNFFWEPRLAGTPAQEERGDRSFWFVTLGMISTFYLPPIEYLYFSLLPHTDTMVASGLGLIVCGSALFVWARRTLGDAYSGHLSVVNGQELVQRGPYRFIRHPAYAGYLLIALGISLGYSSLAGLCAIPLLLVPGLVYRIRLEEKFLAVHFGEQFQRYAARTARLVPGLW